MFRGLPVRFCVSVGTAVSRPKTAELIESRSAPVVDADSREPRSPWTPCVRWGPGSHGHGHCHFRGTCSGHLLGNGRVQSLRADATSSTQREHHAAAMRANDAVIGLLQQFVEHWRI